MAKFLSTDGIISQLETIINSAKTGLVLISPLIKLPDSVFKCIKDANKRQVKTKLVFTKSQINHSTIDQLKQLSDLSMYYSPNLHVKCYFNEKTMIITSLGLNNLLEPKSIEMGVLVTIKNDTDLYLTAVKELGELIERSEEIGFDKAITDKRIYFQEDAGTDEITYTEGFCIRCKAKIIFDSSMPYCDDCFEEWTEWDAKDTSYQERYCHHCGNKWAVSLESTLCSTCSTPNYTNNEES